MATWWYEFPPGAWSALDLPCGRLPILKIILANMFSLGKMIGMMLHSLKLLLGAGRMKLSCAVLALVIHI